MESSSEEQLTHLQRLADELVSRGFTAELLGTSREPSVRATNPDNAEFSERVLCWRADDDVWCFWWPWKQPIGSAEDLTSVAAKIMTALRSVEGAS
ncbi:MAG: hypothetical protein ACRDNZ_01065 [Streptosporangiaceae bacterium]